MKRLLKTAMLSVVALIFGVALFGCDSHSKISPPHNLSLTGSLLAWDYVDGSSGYVVYMNDVEYVIDTNFFEINSVSPAPGTYVITVATIDLHGKRSLPTKSVIFSVVEDWLEATLINDDTEYAVAVKKEYRSTLSGDITVPADIWGVPVTELSDNAFFSCKNITSVTLSDNIKTIGTYAFTGCNSLLNVTLPNSLTTINSYAFNNCDNLTSVTLPEGLKSLDKFAFLYCKNLSSIYFPSTVEQIDATILRNSGVTELTVAENNPILKSDGNCVIRKEDNALVLACATSVMPDYITKICASVFSNSKFADVQLPQSLQEIEASAFYACSNLTQIDLPSGVVAIGDGAFASCSKLERVSFGASLTTIGERAFMDCGNLIEAKLPSGLKEIGDRAFHGCKKLENLTFPQGLTTIGMEAFYYCVLTEVALPNSVTTLGNSAFAFCKELTKLTLSSGIDVIGNSAFEYCMALEEIIIPEGVKTIGEKAFYNCTAVKKIVVPSSVRSIGISAFGLCRNAKSIVIHSGVTEIGEYAFSAASSSSVCSVTLPESVVSLGQHSNYDTPIYTAEMCAIAYDGDAPYVVSIKPSLMKSTDRAVPTREGYSFNGWALSENGPVCHENAMKSTLGGKDWFYVTFTREQMQSVTEDTVWYAVWGKDI